MTRPERAEAKFYGETKKPKQFLLTESASKKLDEMAQQAGMTRSEFIERLIRSANQETVNTVRDFNPS